MSHGPLLATSTVRQLEDLMSALARLQPLIPTIDAAGAEIKRALRGGHKVLTAGNGGSAADALHLAEELVGRFHKERPSLPAVALCADPTLLTCIGNDYGFNRIFSRQVEGLAQSGDILIVFSTSGNSSNIVEALQAARDRNLTSIALLGKDGGACRGLAEHEIVIPCDTTARIQEIHTFILHAWLTFLERDY
jgi:phosphoheptose isomerase